MIDAATASGRRLLLDLLKIAERQDGRLPATRRLTSFTPDEAEAVRNCLRRHHWSFSQETVVVHVKRIVEDEFDGRDDAFLAAAYQATGTKPPRKAPADVSSLDAIIVGSDEVAADLREQLASRDGWVGRSLREGHEQTAARLRSYQAFVRSLPMVEETPLRAAVKRILGSSHALDDDTLLRRAIQAYVERQFGNDLQEADSWLKAGILLDTTRSTALAFGNLQLQIGAAMLDGIQLAESKLPLAFTRDTVARATLVSAPRYALFIEGPATWQEACKYAPHDVVVVLTDGMPSHAVRLLNGLLSGVPQYHWGDVDVGGYTILRQLSCEPLLMDEDTVRASSDNLHSFSAKKKTSFERRLAAHPAPIERNALKASLDEGGWLEQETIPAQRAFQILDRH